MPYLSASAVVIHYEEALYQVYAPFIFSLTVLHRVLYRDYTLPAGDCIWNKTKDVLCDADGRRRC